MAGYSYIRLKHWGREKGRLVPKEDRIAAFTPLLIGKVLKALGDRWKAELVDYEDGGPTWLVTLPGTAQHTEEGAMRMNLAPGDDIGFMLSLRDDGSIAFWHPPNHFERWAQGRVAEELSEWFNTGIHYDATDETTKPGARAYRIGSTYREYLTRNFEKPLKPEDEAWIEQRFKFEVPEGFW